MDKKILKSNKFQRKTINDDLNSLNSINIKSKLNSTSELGLGDNKEEKNNEINKDLTDLISNKIEQNLKIKIKFLIFFQH